LKIYSSIRVFTVVGTGRSSAWSTTKITAPF